MFTGTASFMLFVNLMETDSAEPCVHNGGNENVLMAHDFRLAYNTAKHPANNSVRYTRISCVPCKCEICAASA